MRRVLSAIAATGLLTGTLFIGASAAVAAPYPPHQAIVTSSTTTPFQGQTIKVGGITYGPTEAVELKIGGIFVGTGHTDAGGNFDPNVVVPATLKGDQLLEGIGAEGTPNDYDSLMLHIRVGGVNPTEPGGNANTGAKIAGMVGIAAVLLVGGTALTVFGRRRRASSTHSS